MTGLQKLPLQRWPDVLLSCMCFTRRIAAVEICRIAAVKCIAEVPITIVLMHISMMWMEL